MKYKKEPAFINRQTEIAYLRLWTEQRPESILFFYGPKSSGKTTLIQKFLETELTDQGSFCVKHFNLREILIVSYEDFLQRFFVVEDQEENTRTQTRHYDLKLFKLTVEEQRRIKARQLDPFDVMKAEFRELNAKDVKPILIIDELQALDFIYFNSQRELIKELINFFVAMTKESHLCHVLLSSSDGYFIEKLYNDSKLKKTSELFEVDYLPKVDIVYWLNNLEKESNIKEYSLSQDQIEYIWEHFGGSIWEISNLLGKFLTVCQDGKVPDDQMRKLITKYMMQARSYFEEYAGLKRHLQALFAEVHKKSAKGFFKETELGWLVDGGFFTEDKLREELNSLVQKNFFYYDPTLAEYKLQGRCMEIGLEMYLREVHVGNCF
ncbi:ATP-binding protein [Desulfonatronospira sp.]|uniref:ATP-binding protein n=1 Tax=Desulfonatronospira sp. TaxID=1962951 RepID=UPI0025C4EC35|nr:ATP-binding protein [Desulfonatronospira sp.]